MAMTPLPLFLLLFLRYQMGVMSGSIPDLCIGFDLLLTPLPGKGNDVTALEVTETLSNIDFSYNEQILSLPKSVAGVDVGYMKKDSPIVLDSIGPVHILDSLLEEGPLKRKTWKVTRSTVGDISIRYTVLPRPVSNTTRNGPALDFRMDQGGLIGSGVGFLAIPPDRPDRQVCTTIKWDLSRSPPGTSAAWTFGDGEETVSLSGPNGFSKIQNTYFAVGSQLNRLVAPSDSPNTKAFNVYWFGTPPFDPYQLGSRLQDLFERMCIFFSDKGESYRIFMRRNPFSGSLTGTALDRSFLYGYDDSEVEYPPTLGQRESVLAHEMVHDWVRLDQDTVRDAWYTEGLAEYFQVLLRYRFGLVSSQQYLKSVNNRLTAYYTNPLLTWSLDEVQKSTWSISHAQRVPYHRGFVFGLLLNGMIRQASKGTKFLDDLVLSLVDMRQKGGTPGVEDFVTLLSASLGDASVATRLVENMRAGKVLAPMSNSLDRVEFDTRLASKKLAKFELGFEEKSLASGDHTVRGLISGSQAEKAGVREGDRVDTLFGSAYNVAKDVYEAKLKLKVERSGLEPFVVEYWPRSQEMVKGYLYEAVQSSGEL